MDICGYIYIYEHFKPENESGRSRRGFGGLNKTCVLTNKLESESGRSRRGFGDLKNNMCFEHMKS